MTARSLDLTAYTIAQAKAEAARRKDCERQGIPFIADAALPHVPHQALPIVKRVGRPMNKTEAAYATILEAAKRIGKIDDYVFEGVRVVLADGVRYTPDFAVWLSLPNGRWVIELHEVKGGFIRDDARVKLRTAATLFPCFHFKLCQYKQHQWSIEGVATR